MRMTSLHLPKLLDCTLRDGGYYTQWDFDDSVVQAYVDAMNQLPIDYLEVGYRNNPTADYLGKFGYTPISVMRQLRQRSSKKLALMLNEKSTAPTELDRLIQPLRGLVDMVRIAVDPRNFQRAVVLAKAVKAYGFEVGFNVMYMSQWGEYDGFLSQLPLLNEVADLFCLVDSYGGVTPDEVRETIRTVKKYTSCPIGFHGHNNLQLGLINTLTAIQEGVDFVDATILGMGRGAGNLNMELLLTYLNQKQGLTVDFNVLGDVISAFMPLYRQYQWGTNLPYMISGANSLPQKEVMDWVSNRAYSFNSIVRALDNRREKLLDNAKYPEFHPSKKYSQVLIIGGGDSVVHHQVGLAMFLAQRPDTALVFATARFAAYFAATTADKYFCLIGNEAKRLAQNTQGADFAAQCILPPYPRKMGTEVPEYLKAVTSELPSIQFANAHDDSCTALAIQLALDLSEGDIFVAGYDGYPGGVLSEKETALTTENRELFDSYAQYTGRPMRSLTPSLYKGLEISSLYQYI